MDQARSHEHQQVLRNPDPNARTNLVGGPAEFVRQHLRAVGIPPAPGTWWEALLPEDMDLDDLAERLDVACGLAVGVATGLEAAQREAEVILSVTVGPKGAPPAVNFEELSPKDLVLQR